MVLRDSILICVFDCRYYLNGITINGYYELGWALILAIVASLVNYISFAFFLLEYKDMTDMAVPRPTKV